MLFKRQFRCDYAMKVVRRQSLVLLAHREYYQHTQWMTSVKVACSVRSACVELLQALCYCALRNGRPDPAGMHLRHESV